MKAIVEPL